MEVELMGVVVAIAAALSGMLAKYVIFHSNRYEENKGTDGRG